MGSDTGPSSRPIGRLPLVVVSALLASTLLLPLWTTLMEAPQYREDEILEVEVFAGRVRGDIHEIELLNEYVGVHLPLDTPELEASPWVLGGLLVLSLITLVLPLGARRRVALVLCLLMAVLLVGGAGLLQYRLYQLGHERSPSIMARVPDFTPPILGSKKIANFEVHMSLAAGGWAYLGALLLIAWTVRQSRPRAAGDLDGIPAQPRSEPAEYPRESAYARVGDSKWP